MGSLLMDFQKKMLDKDYSVSDLLRSGLIIASKLRSDEMKKWINSELYGYKNGEKVPEYRRVPMTVKFLNSLYGWCPVVIQNQKMLDVLSNMNIRQPISEIEILSNAKENSEVHFDVPLSIKKDLSSQIPFETDINYICSTISFCSIIDSVKNTLLAWILDLEQNGIIDKNMVFEEEQVEKAKNITPQVVNNFYGDRGKIEVNQEIN